jgi:hypothetical protein
VDFYGSESSENIIKELYQAYHFKVLFKEDSLPHWQDSEYLFLSSLMWASPQGGSMAWNLASPRDNNPDRVREPKMEATNLL